MFLTYLLIIAVAALLVMNIYSTGGFVGTDPYYQAQFTNDYLSVMNASQCSQILPIVNRMGVDRNYRHWIARNENELRKLYNQNLMREKINSMKCVDNDGSVIELGGG